MGLCDNYPTNIQQHIILIITSYLIDMKTDEDREMNTFTEDLV